MARSSLAVPSWQQERFSIAYISAVVTHAGFQFTEPSVDTDSVDGVIQSSHGRRPKIDFQAKATGQNLLQEDHIAFPLSIKNYNDLRENTISPRILIVVLLPPKLEDWLQQSTEQLILRHCGYWVSLKGLPDRPGQKKVTVKIPRSQVFDSAQLAILMQRTNDGVFP